MNDGLQDGTDVDASLGLIEGEILGNEDVMRKGVKDGTALEFKVFPDDSIVVGPAEGIAVGPSDGASGMST
jgi:hypothetical protein